MQKTLDEKLGRHRAGTATARDFILADAKDADMAFGVTAPGPRRDAEGKWKSLPDYLDQCRVVVRQGIVDIMLLSASNLERLAIDEVLFRDSPVTTAARANDSSDIWLGRGAGYAAKPSRPFRTATIDHLKFGRQTDDASLPVRGCDLGLYSLTFTNDLEADLRSLEAFGEFRREAEQKQFRYFLEVFKPNVDPGFEPENTGPFLNDQIVRALAGVTRSGRPLFLKIPYLGPRSLEELVSYDPSVIVGIMGGAAGTTRDAFQLLADAQRYGARAALFGRKTNLSEHPLLFVSYLRRLADGEVTPTDAVKAYHAELARAGIAPHRPLDADLQLTDPALRAP